MFIKLLCIISSVTSLINAPVKPKTNFVFVGDTPPLGYFDPLGILAEASEEDIKFSREAELKHGRIAMVAAVLQPFLENGYHKPFINILSDSGMAPNFMFFATAGLFESIGLFYAWETPFGKESKLFTLREDHEPGCYNPDAKIIWGDFDLLNKELNNGRLAMLAIAYTMAHELYNEFSI